MDVCTEKKESGIWSNSDNEHAIFNGFSWWKNICTRPASWRMCYDFTIIHYAKEKMRYYKNKFCAPPKPNRQTIKITETVRKYAFSTGLRNLTRNK